MFKSSVEVLVASLNIVDLGVSKRFLVNPRSRSWRSMGSTVMELDASPCVVVLGVLGASAVVVVVGMHQLLTNSVQEAERSLAVLTSTELGNGEHARQGTAATGRPKEAQAMEPWMSGDSGSGSREGGSSGARQAGA